MKLRANVPKKLISCKTGRKVIEKVVKIQAQSPSRLERFSDCSLAVPIVICGVCKTLGIQTSFLRSLRKNLPSVGFEPTTYSVADGHATTTPVRLTTHITFKKDIYLANRLEKTLLNTSMTPNDFK